MDTKIIIAIAVAAVVVVGGGVGIAIALSNGGDSEPSYTVTFNVNGGNAIEEKSFTKNTDTFALPDAVRDGYTFLGWYGSSDFTGEKITQVEKGTEKDITVYAKWQLVMANNTIPTAAQVADNTDIKVTFTNEATNEAKVISNEVRDALTSGKTLVVEDTQANLTWTFTGSDSKQDGYNNEAFDTAVEATADVENKKVTLSFDYEGTLPYQSTVRYLFGVNYAGQQVTAENSRTHEVIGPYTVDSQGYVEFPIDHCSDWTLSVSLNVRFDANGGTINGEGSIVIIVPYNDPVGTLPTAKRTGYAFNAWSSAVTAETIVTENVTYTATWTENTYTVNFDKNSNDATGSMDPITVTYTGTQNIPACTFGNRGYSASWNTLADGSGTAIAAEGAITGQLACETAAVDSLVITLFAQWSANTYAVAFDGNGGSVPATDATKNVVFKTAYGALPTTATRDGYNFTGWNTAANGGGSTVIATTLYEIAANSTLYAQWELITYNITYVMGDGATNALGNPTTYNVTQNLEFAGATKDGEAFMGWFKDSAYATGEVTTIAAGSSVGDLTLYAKWGKNNVTVSFSKDGAPMNVTGNVTLNKDANSAAMALTTNTGVYYYETSDAFAITDAEYTIKMGDKTVGTVTVENGRGIGYVYFYTVTFVSDEVTLETQTVLMNETASAPGNEPTKTGYHYTEWASDAGAIWNFSNPVTRTTTLRPGWQPNTYNVTFAKGEGAGGSNGATATYDANIPNVTVPERDGFDFLGYFYGDVKYINELGQGVKAWDRTVDTELTAHWDVKKYRAVINSSGTQPVGTIGQGWDNNGGMYVKMFEFGTSISSIITDFGATFSKSHQTFTGWDPSTGTLGTEGVTILPTFTPVDYTVVFNTNGGSGSVASVQNIHSGSVLAQPAYDGTKVGFNNAGSWCYDDDGILNAVFTDGSMTVNDTLLDNADEEHGTITLYAKWDPINYRVNFDCNGGIGDAPAQLINKHFGDTISCGTPAVTKESKFFGGWNTKADGTGTNYKGSATVNADFIQYAEGTTVTLYIKWVDSLYTATVGDVFSGHNYNYGSNGQQLYASDWKAVVIWANAISYQIEMMYLYNEEWQADGFVTLAQGRYPNLYMDEDEGFAETMRSSGEHSTDQMTVSFNGENRAVDLDVYTLTTQYGTTIIAEDADGTCFYYRTSSGGGSMEFFDSKMAMESLAEGESNGYTPTSYSVSYLSTKYSESPIVVSSQRYKNPEEIGMAIPDGKVFVGWMPTDKNYYGVDDNDRLYNSSQIVTCPHELYAIFVDLVIEPTNIDWSVHNKPAGITMTIDGNDAYESNGDNGKYVVFTGGTDWSKELVSEGQYRYTFTLDGKTYHLQMYKYNNAKVSEVPDGNVMRILFGKAVSEQYVIDLYFWMDMPHMNGYLATVDDAFTYHYSGYGGLYTQDKTFTVTSVEPNGRYSTESDGSFNDYRYPADNGGIVAYLQFDTGDYYSQYAGRYVWTTDSFTYGDSNVSCYLIRDSIYKRDTVEGVASLTQAVVSQGYYGVADGLLYELRRDSSVTTLTSKPTDLQSVAQYQVVLNGNGGLFDGQPTCTLDYAFTLDDDTPGYADREFLKWNTLANGTGRDYVDGDRFNPADLVDGVIVLYAQWILDGFYVNVTAEGATPGTLLIERPVSTLNLLSTTYYPYDFTGITPPSGKAASAIGFQGSQFDSVTIKRNNYSMHDNGDGTYSHSSDNGYSKVPSKEVYYRSGGFEGFMWLDVIALSGETVDLSLVWTEEVTAVTYHSNFAPDATTVINYPQFLSYDGYFPAADLYTRENYSFIGWGTAANADVGYAAGAQFDTAMGTEFWAIWKLSMTVTYNASGGNGTVADQTIYLGNNVLSNGNGLSKDGFVLVGWATAENSTTLAYPLSGKYVMQESQAGTTLNLYAVWATGTYTVHFNLATAGGLEFEGEMDDQIIGVGITTPLNPVGFREPTGFYVFGYWTPTEDGGEPKYYDGDTVLNLVGEGQTYTLNTWWNPVKYYVQFELNPPAGSDLEGEAYRQIISRDVPTVLTECGFEGNEDYRFVGWNTLANGSGTAYAADAAVLNLAVGGDTIQLFAQWAHTKFTVRFQNDLRSAGVAEGDRESFEGEMYTQVINMGEPTALEPCGFSDTSYRWTFVGWNTRPDGSGTDYAPGAMVTDLCDGKYAFDLYAQWERTSYTLVFYPGEGASGSMDNQNRIVDDGLALPACTFTAPEGMVFDHWLVEYGDDETAEFNAGYTGDITYVHDSAPKVTAVWVDAE